MDMKLFARSALSATTLLAAVAAAPAQAVTTVSRDFEGNDCAGYFGQGFDACTIFVNDSGQRIEISPVIAKWDVDLDSWETNNTVYPSINGSEFTTTDNPWVYTPNNTTDPYVRYWATKAGNAFKLFWTVDDSAVALGGACDVSDVYSLGCLNQALTVNTGAWTTPNNKTLSHITFYDSDDPVTVVPVPAALWLFGSGLLGLVGVARKRS